MGGGSVGGWGEGVCVLKLLAMLVMCFIAIIMLSWQCLRSVSYHYCKILF